MQWKQARETLQHEYVDAAASWIRDHCKENEFSNLYEKTGCHPPRKRWISYGGDSFPAKAFGYLVLLNAGWHMKDGYRPTVNEVISPIRKFGVRDL